MKLIHPRPTPLSTFLLTCALAGAPLGSAYAQGNASPPKDSKVPATAAPAPKPKPDAAPATKPKPATPAKPEAAPATKPPAPVPAKPEAPAVKPAVETPVKPKKKKDDSVSFFRDGVAPHLKIQIADGELQQLRQKNREYVRCTVIEDDKTTYENVGIHLKGAAGSFRGVDDRPALTLNFDKFKDDQEFHDLDKIHLNNSVQDPSVLNELLSSDLNLAAGVPAARVTHARVWLNGRDLGVYVLMEGFNKKFLKRHGLDPEGNFYEPVISNDLDGQITLQSGTGPSDRSDVKAVIAACREPDPAKRWQRVEQVVDIDRFISFMALELMNCHWDGYCQARNNYRFYFDPKSRKIQFFPHGMDQMFNDPNFNVLGVPSAMVANAVMSNPEWRGRYRDRLTELLDLFSPPDKLLARIEAYHLRVRPLFAEINAGAANNFDGQVKQIKDRITARAKVLTQQTTVVEARPLRFNADGIAPLSRWEPRTETTDARLEKLEKLPAPASGSGFTIATGPGNRCVASWRSKVILTAGKYRFEARARTQGVKALADSPGTGAGLRISGGSRTQKLDGTSDWTPLVHEFQVSAPTQEVELVAELRATAGQAFFEAGSLRLVRVPK